MIKDVEGDILLSGAEAIAHGVAPSDHFSTGLAHALREHYPVMVKDFRHYCQQNHPHPGALWQWAGVGEQGKPTKIISLLTQDPSEGAGGLPGKAKETHVGHALKALAKLIKDEGIKSIALPRLATGVGGLEWNHVRPLIDKYLGDCGIPVYLYVTYHAGVAAPE